MLSQGSPLQAVFEGIVKIRQAGVLLKGQLQAFKALLTTPLKDL